MGVLLRGEKHLCFLISMWDFSSTVLVCREKELFKNSVTGSQGQ